jgi:23S rRNA (cytidine1920-2'-O)/16S rRNA (cytidine1409-2'-O)-methyltransferase
MMTMKKMMTGERPTHRASAGTAGAAVAPAARPTTRPTTRIDLLMVEQGMAASRERAQQLVMSGAVRVDGRPIEKPGQRIACGAAIVVTESARYVGRGGLKLEGALAAFGLPVGGRVALDVGASTGGFTDCLLQHGACRVYAVDVGYGQLAWSLRQDPRVIAIERTNIRTMPSSALPEPVDLVTVDVSFISLRLVLPVLRSSLAPSADLVVLVKPQFEVGRNMVGRGGVVRDPRLQEAAVQQIRAAAETMGYQVNGQTPSVLPGPKGNQEHFLWLGYPLATSKSGARSSQGENPALPLRTPIGLTQGGHRQ